MSRCAVSTKFTAFKLEEWLKQYKRERALKTKEHHDRRMAKTLGHIK